jgi:hypothetical protein
MGRGMRLPILVVALAACGSSSDSTSTATQMNDISVMLPLPTSSGEVDAMLAPTASANGGELLPQDVYSMGGEVEYEQLRVVGFRFDPCFGAIGTITPDTPCDNQLRLVFQPVSFDQDATPPVAFAQDAAVHAFYSLTREQLLDAIDEVVAARESDAGDDDLGPLAPHPVIVRETNEGTLAQAYRAIITKYAGAANLVRFTTLEVELVDAGGSNIVGDGLFWELEGHDVAAGVTTPLIIPTLPDAPTAMSIEANAVPLEAQTSPLTTSGDGFPLLQSFSQASTASSAARQAALDGALRVLNPRDNSPNTIDCGSCHLAQPAIQVVGEQLGMSVAGNPNAFAPSALIPSADLAQTTQPVNTGDQSLNIHAFSYRSASPMINQRVIDETAANLEYLSSL